MNILIAVDSSQASAVAAREAAARPWPAGTTARIISVVEPMHGWSVPEIEDALQQSACRTVRSMAELFNQAGLAATTAVFIGDPKHMLVREADDSHADFIVIGSHSTHGAMQFLLGGVARAVARLAPCSVEIVRRNPGPEPLKILLATDGSESSEAAARSVAGRPWPEHSVFRILSVIEPSAPLFRPPYFSHEMMEQLRAQDMQRAQEAVSSAEGIFDRAGR